ncbi:hypothetical protein [Deinococcus sp.]|uniref:hypothetical protein n=1 Tax=Deinococcus sp. TaxID=47478 RepID=UPI002869B888|nr:hypothetical protein [Deinococcus sp.]
MRVPLPMTFLPALLLSACAPSATGKPATQTSTLPTLIRQGDTFMISGRDQNNDAMSGTVTLARAPKYKASNDSWEFNTPGGYVILASQTTGGTSQFWDTRDPKRNKACIVFGSVAQDGPGGVRGLKTTISGVGIAGSEAELNAVFAKLSGSGTKLTGGSCTVTRK